MLVKGCQGRVIRLRSAGSRLFDEVFFVLREGAGEAEEGDILTEANRILEENMLPPRAAGRTRPPLFFLLLGAVGASLCWFFVLLFLFV